MIRNGVDSLGQRGIFVPYYRVGPRRYCLLPCRQSEEEGVSGGKVKDSDPSGSQALEDFFEGFFYFV